MKRSTNCDGDDDSIMTIVNLTKKGSLSRNKSHSHLANPMEVNGK